MPRPLQSRVFLNIPYDEAFQNLYIAYIVGLVEFNLTPVLTLENATGTTRIDRLFALLRSCRYSIHDLSRIQPLIASELPRFNMPFELGLAVSISLQAPSSHTWIGFDSKRYQAQRTLSDLSGSDFNVHGNTPKGVLAALCNVFVLEGRPPLQQMLTRFEIVQAALPELLKSTGAEDPFQPRMLHELIQAAQRAVPPKSPQPLTRPTKPASATTPPTKPSASAARRRASHTG